ncbi:MAG: histidine phosphatase family protein [Hyphomicrobiales bacterium]|nr:histidine phosphatase family protein [Hyphomicrobiales bacterium]
MQIANRFIALLSLALFFTPAAAQDGLLTGNDLLQRLRQGGLVIYFRHARTDWSERDAPRPDLNDCATQRNLSADGRAQAERTGAAMKRLGVPVGRVVASPFCRTRQHAELAFGRVELDPDLEQLAGWPDDVRAARTARLRALLTTAPQAANTVVIGYQASLRAAAGVGLQEGEAVIFEPNAAGPKPIGRAPSEAWDAMAPR